MDALECATKDEYEYSRADWIAYSFGGWNNPFSVIVRADHVKVRRDYIEIIELHR